MAHSTSAAAPVVRYCGESTQTILLGGPTETLAHRHTLGAPAAYAF